MISFTSLGSLQSPPRLERGNLPVQSPQFTGGKSRTWEGKWLGQGHTAMAGEVEIELIVLQTSRLVATAFPLLHTLHLPNCKAAANSLTAPCGNQLGRDSERRGIAPKERSLESSTPKDIKQKGRLDPKAKAMPKCHRCHKLGGQTCQTRYNYPAC